LSRARTVPYLQRDINRRPAHDLGSDRVGWPASRL